MGDTKRQALLAWWFQEAIGKTPFPYQERILAHQGPLVINKARQTGISTTMACMAVSVAALGNQKVLICSNKEDSAKHILQYAWDFIHPLVDTNVIKKPMVDQAGFIRWEDGGEIRCQAASASAGRGYPVDLAIMDEFAHFTKEIDLDRKMLISVKPTLAQTGGRLILLSTPNGTKNQFYKEWDATPEMNRITVHWTDCPSLKIREEVLPFGRRYWIGNSPTPMSEPEFRQEFCNDFYIGSDEAIPLEALRAAMMPTEDIPVLHNISIGTDIGYEVDKFAITVTGLDAEKNAWIREIQEHSRLPFPDQQVLLKEAVERYGAVRLVMDRTYNPQSTSDAQRQPFGYIVEPFVFTEQSKRDLIANAGSYFTAGRVKCPPRNFQAINEIGNIRKVVSDAGNILYKDKPHGDIGWACLLALWGLPREEAFEMIPFNM